MVPRGQPIARACWAALPTNVPRAQAAQSAAMGLGVMIGGAVLLSWRSANIDAMEQQRTLRRAASGKVPHAASGPASLLFCVAQLSAACLRSTRTVTRI